jgi:hypothetical protein
MEKLVCECCGGIINRSTMTCEFCGTQYKKSEYECAPIRIETYRNPVQTLSYDMDITDMVEHGLSSKDIAEITVKTMCNKLSEQIAPYVKMRQEEVFSENYPFRRIVVRGDLKLIQPVQ